MKRSLLKYLGVTAITATFFFTACSDDSSSSVSPDTTTLKSSETIASSSSTTKEESSDAKSSSSSVSSSNVSSSSVSSSSVSSSSAKEKVATSSESEPPASSETEITPAKSWRENCLDTINAYRATEGAAPLTLAADSLQTCTDKQAAADMEAGSAHGHFGSCHEMAQNTGPNINTQWMGTDTTKIAYYYSAMMWEDEKKLVTSGERDPNKDEDYSYIGHYLNMRNTKYTKVACGFAVSKDGKTAWLNMNFFK